jgi:integrase
MGSIYRRKWKDKDGNTKTGEILWIKYYDRNGKPIRESTGSTKDSDAKRLLKRREGEISSGKLPGIYFDRVKFDELAEDFLSDYRINGKDVVRAKLSIKHLKPEFEGMRVTAITTPKIKSYIERRLAGGAANATINRELAALKRMLNIGSNQTPPRVDKVPYIPMLKENNVRKGFFEHDQFLALRDAMPEHLKGFVTFGYKVGWRISEISNLTWSQVDLKQGIVRLEAGETKNHEARTVYLDDELQEIFGQQRKLRKKLGTALPYVFLNHDGTDRVKRFDKAWRTACKKAKIGVRLFHDFRRTAVRNMVRAGVPERVAMMISGHKTRAVFDRYNIVSDADLRLAAQRQAEYLESVTGTVTGTVHYLNTRKTPLRL